MCLRRGSVPRGTLLVGQVFGRKMSNREVSDGEVSTSSEQSRFKYFTSKRPDTLVEDHVGQLHE